VLGAALFFISNRSVGKRGTIFPLLATAFYNIKFWR
jgi:hypothetical protein